MPFQYVFHESLGYTGVAGRVLTAQDYEIDQPKRGHQFRARALGEQRLSRVRHFHDQQLSWFTLLFQPPDVLRQQGIEVTRHPYRIRARFKLLTRDDLRSGVQNKV